MRKNRKKRPDVALPVDFRRPRTFASGVVRTLLPSWSRRASLPPAPVGWLGCAPALVVAAALGCQPSKPVATGGAAHFEIPFSHEPGPETGSTPANAGTPSVTSTRAALPQTLPSAFVRQQICDRENCSLVGWLPDPSYAESPFEGVPTPAAIWVHVLRAPAKLSVPPSAALELVVVCLSGEIAVKDTLQVGETAASPPALRPWTALRAAGAGVELECAQGECRAMLALIAPNSTLASALATTPVAAPRTVPLDVKSFDDAAVAAQHRGAYQARVLFGGTRTNPPLPFSLSLLEADAPVLIAPHSHGGSWENLLVLAGQGDLELRGRSYPIEGGESLHIAPRVRHGYVARGQARFVALQLYTPAGPEQLLLGPPAAAPAAVPAATSAGPRPPQEPP